jgi:putative chitinase
MSALDKLNAAVFTALGCSADKVPAVTAAFQSALSLRGLTSPLSIAAILGQCAVESGRFKVTEENLFYSTPAVLARTFRRISALPETDQAQYLRSPQKLANFVYSSKNGNGDVASGDGWKYRGMGYIQTTFHDNYAAAAQDTGRPYVDHPELLVLPPDAAVSAVSYCLKHDVHMIAQAQGITDDSVHLITSKVNSALLDLETRTALSKKVLALLS